MVQIRQADPADRDRLREIQQAAIAEPWPELLNAAVEGAVPASVAEDEDVVGYAIVVPGDETAAYVPELAISPARQREGHGSRLVAALSARLATEGYDAVRLTAREVDDDARAFYEDLGFVEVDRASDYFDSGDGIVLERDL